MVLLQPPNSSKGSWTFGGLLRNNTFVNAFAFVLVNGGPIIVGRFNCCQQGTTNNGSTPAAQSTKNVTTDPPGKRRSIVKNSQNDNEETNDRKPAAKRKHRVNFDTDDDDDDGNHYNENSENDNDDGNDDDSLYGDDGFLLKEENVGDGDYLGDYDTDDPENPQQQLASSSTSFDFHEHYAKALHVLYGPPDGPSSSSVAAEPPRSQYLQTLQETFAPPVPPIMQYPQPTQLLQPLPKRVRNRQTKTWTNVLETPEQAQERVHRHQRFVERLKMSHRWKARVVDFRNEPDVGGAIYHRAKRHLQDKVRRELKEQRQQEATEKQAAVAVRQRKEEQASNLLQDEDSVQEQQGVLDRLTQQSADDDESNMNETVASTNYTSADETIAEWSDYSVPYKEHMDYWNYGYTCPPDVEYHANNTSLRPQIPLGHNEKLKDPDPHGLRLRRVPRFTNANMEGQDDWQPSYFPPSTATSNPRFFQYRLLQALVTRHLCGPGTNKDVVLQERLLRLLFAPTHHEGVPLAKFSRTRTHLKISSQLGCNALLYTQHTWSNPEEVARVLGLRGNDALAGQTQNPNAIHNFLTALRRYVLQKYRLKKIPWNHHQDKQQPSKNVHPNPEIQQEPSALEQVPPDHPSPSAVGQDHVGASSETMAAVRQSNTDSPSSNTRARARRHLLDSQNEALNQAMTRRSQATKRRGQESREEGTKVIDSEGPQPDGTNSHFPTPLDEPDDSDASDLGKVNNNTQRMSIKNVNQSITSLGSNKETTVEGTSQGGVIFHLGTHPSEHSSKKSRTSFDDPPSHIAMEEAQLFPTSTFAHVPGTSPPIPPFPLDPTCIVYGPIDRFARFNHQENHVHHGHLQLALSTLLSRVMQSDNERHRQAIHTLLNEYIALTGNKGYKRHFLQSHGKVRDVPLVQFYRALGIYCSFLVNGYPSLKFQNESAMKEEDDDDDDDAMEDLSDVDATKRDPLNSREVAEQLFKLLEHRIHHNGLIRFPRLKEIFALATMARKLPVGAATILSRPMKEDECPLHVMRECIEYLEQNSLIRGGQGTAGYFDADDESIRHGELEYIFHDASERFENCINADPMSIEFYAWRLGALAVSFLLCSGNRIGGARAVRYPSAWKHKAFERIGKRRGGDSHLDHEVREKLPKFEEVALQLTSAIQALFTLMRYQPGAKAHLTIVTLLEWHQVMALLAGDTLELHTDNIKSLYRHHTVQRFFQENSTIAREGIDNLSKSVGFYAMELENDPENMECWRALVNALGPVGTKCDTIVDTSHRDACLHCQLVRQGRRIDHERTENLGCNWWGHGRQWWLTTLLHIPKDPNERRNQSTTEPVLYELEESTHELPDVQSDLTEDPNLSANNNAFLGWLPTKSDLQERRKKLPSKEEREASFHHSLPPFSHDQDPVGNNNTSEICTIADHVSPELEILVYKVLIYCHFKGPGDPVVYDRIYTLVRESWDNKAECVKSKSEAFQGILWLYNAGIDIPTMCRRYYPKPPPSRPLQKNYVVRKVRKKS